MWPQHLRALQSSRPCRDNVINKDNRIWNFSVRDHSKAIFFIFKSFFSGKMRLVTRPFGTEEFLEGNSCLLRQIFDNIVRMIKPSHEIPTPVHRNRNKDGFFSIFYSSLFDNLRQEFAKYFDIFSIRKVFESFNHFFYLTILGCDENLVHFYISSFFLVMKRQVFSEKFWLRENILLHKYLTKKGKEIHYFLRERIYSERILTPHPVAHFGIYPQFVSR